MEPGFKRNTYTVAKLGTNFGGLSDWIIIFLCSEIGFSEVIEKKWGLTEPSDPIGVLPLSLQFSSFFYIKRHFLITHWKSYQRKI
jgi:hypothetical protein